MNFDLNSQLEKIDARAAAEKQNAILLASIAASLPEGLTVERLTVHAVYADARLTLAPVGSILAADALMRRLPPLPLARIKNGSVSYRPEEIIGRDPRLVGAECQTIAPFVLKHEEADYQQIPRTLEWYTRLAGLRVMVELPITDYRLSVVILPRRRNDNGTYTTMAHCSSNEAQKDSFWVSEPKKIASIVFYWKGQYTKQFKCCQWPEELTAEPTE